MDGKRRRKGIANGDIRILGVSVVLSPVDDADVISIDRSMNRDVLMKVARVLGGEEAVKTVEVLGLKCQRHETVFPRVRNLKSIYVLKILYRRLWKR